MSANQITFIDRNGRTKLQCKLSSLPLKEEKIIEKSIELFNDPEPCIIHKSYVIRKILLEIDEYLGEVLLEGKGQIIYENIPKNIRELLNISDEVIE